MYIILGRSFFFGGCGWPSSKPKPNWSVEDKAWIMTMNTFMQSLFGKEFLHYEFDKKKVCYVSAEDMPKYEYNHDEWETEYHKNNNRTPSSPALPTGEAIKSHKEKSSLEQQEDASSLAVNWLILVLAKKNGRTQDQQKLTKSLLPVPPLQSLI